MNRKTTGRTIVPMLFAAAVAVRLPALVEPLGIDQGIFAYAGRALNRGEALYRDVWDQKPPGIHLTYAAGFRAFGDRPSMVAVLDLVASAGTAAVLVPVGGLLLRHPGAGWLPALVFLAGTWPAGRFGYGGFLERAVPETFISFWITAAALVLLRGSTSTAAQWPLLFAGGALCGVAALYKPTAAFYPIAFAGWLPAFRRTSGKSGGGPVPLIAMAAGFSVPVIMMIGWLAVHGVVREAWIAVVEYNGAYVAAVSHGPLQLVSMFARETWGLVKSDPLWLLGACGALLAGRRAWSGDREAAFALVWLAAAGLAIVANGGRLFATYFLQAQPALAVLAASLMLTLWRPPARSPATRLACRGALALVIALSVARAHLLTRGLAALAVDVARLRGTLSETTYLEKFGGYATGRGYSARANLELTQYLAARTAPHDRVFIFGFEPGVYYAADRRAASRYLSIGPVVAGFLPHRREFTLAGLAAELDATPPELLILERNNRDRFLGWESGREFARPEMQDLVARRYTLEAIIEDFEIYRRTGES